MDAIAYEKIKQTSRHRSREVSFDGRDIGPIPRPVNPRRKSRCRSNFRAFANSYFPETFTLKWSPDHLTVIGQIEESVLRGGLFATAMPRGSGKTTLAEIASVWAMLYGHRRFVALIGSDADHAVNMLESIKSEFELNPLLADDFPEVALPILALEGISNRCKGQLCQGQRTHISWTSETVVLPTIVGSRASGATIRVRGLTGGIRGMKYKRVDGGTVRPDLVVIDDPQTDASARSVSQCDTRKRILFGAVLGLAGPGKKIAGIMPCTVIAPDDLADEALDRDRHPEWNGTRTKLVYDFPTETKLWDEYKQLRDDSLRAQRGGVEATEFYARNRPAMDAGSRVAWAARFNPDELSAIQHAMNLLYRDARAFHAEYQNEPMREELEGSTELTPELIMGRINRMERGAVGTGCNRLTAFIDVQQTLLYYLVAAWEDDFTGSVIAYGTFPDQRAHYFSLREAKVGLADLFPTAGLEGQIYAGLEQLVNALCGREWTRDDGASVKLDRCLIDANWGQSTKVVYRFCRQSAHAAVLLPSHGHYLGASNNPMSQWQKKPGDRVGLNWRIRGSREERGVRSVTFDTNFWKSFASFRLATAMGDRGALSIYGGDKEAHRLLADHWCSEYRVRTEGRGRTVDEWKQRAHRPDNHWLDCLVGCAVAASILGVSLTGSGAAPESRPVRRRVSAVEMQRLANQR